MNDLAKSIHDAGLKNQVIALHASYKSLHTKIKPAGVIEAFDMVCDTVMAPAFYYGAHCPPDNLSQNPVRNATSPEFFKDMPANPVPFNAIHSPVDSSMGILAATLCNHPEAVRSDHPIVGWSAIGYKAHALMDNHPWQDPYWTLRNLVNLKGKVVMLGTYLTSCTLLHLAEEQAGRHPFIRWTRTAEGTSASCRVGGCSDGFGRLWPELETVFREVKILNATARIADAGDLLAAATALIKARPPLTMCARKCERCMDAALGGPAC